MSKQKKVIIIVIALLIICIAIISVLLVIKNKKTETITLYGHYCDIETESKNAAYQKSYLMMDCCEEWDELYKDMLKIENLVAVEGYEIYLYDENGKVISGDNTITFIPTEKFNSFVEKYDDEEKKFDIYYWEEGTDLELLAENANDYKLKTNKQGIFVLALTGKKIPNKPFVSNPPCTGQCRTCE